MLPSSVDVVIIGAGPAGSTLAALLRRHRPSTSVLVLERERLPRHRIGESLLVDVNRILADMGALAAVESAGFSRKYGATFVWGDEREPFHFLWSEGKSLVSRPEGYQLEYTWHVDRAEYDRLLAEAAREAGARVEEAHTVTGFIREGDRVGGVRVRPPEGVEHTVRARFVIDCAGAHGPIHRQLAGKQLDESLRNVALFGYRRGVGTHPDLGGTDHPRTLILTHPRGWVWVIPLRDGITSVGFVTDVHSHRAAAVQDKVAHYESILKSLREYERLFADSELVDYRGDGKRVHAIQEYSYQCEQIWGPGWVTCGNAAGFVDAILSIGVYMAQTHAQFLACALRSVLDAEADEADALECYATTVRENLAAFRAVAHMFYAYNASMSDWWRTCSEQLRASTLVPDDRNAFLAFFTGFSARSAIYEEAVNAFGGSFLFDVGRAIFDDRTFASDAVSQEVERARDLVRRDPALRLVAQVQPRNFWLPDVRNGRLASVTRIDVALEGPCPPLARRLYLPPSLAQALPLFDGSRTLGQIATTLAADGPVERRAVWLSELCKLAYRLTCMGAVVEA